MRREARPELLNELYHCLGWRFNGVELNSERFAFRIWIHRNQAFIYSEQEVRVEFLGKFIELHN